MTNYATNQKSENARLASESEFKQRYQLSDEEWTDLVSFAKSKQLDLEDIYYLKNRTNREQNIQRSAQEEVGRQMQNVRQRPQSLAASGATPEQEESPDDEVFDKLLGGDNINRLFG